MTNEDYLKKIEKRIEDLEKSKTDSLEMELKLKVKDFRKTPESYDGPDFIYSKSLECEKCNFFIEFRDDNLSMNPVEIQVLQAALTGSKELEELKPFYDLEFSHSSSNPRRTYEKALLIAQKHTDKGHIVRYHDLHIFHGIHIDYETDYITDRNGNRTMEKKDFKKRKKTLIDKDGKETIVDL